MTETDIRSSIFQYLSTQLSATIDAGGADNFDPHSQAVDDWCTFRLDVFSDPHKRRDGRWRPRIRFLAHCRNRENVNIYAASDLAASVAAVFRSAASIPIRDYSTSDEDIVGYATFSDPQTTDESENEDEAGWQLMMVSVDGFAEAQ